jgi:hypothetical protein
MIYPVSAEDSEGAAVRFAKLYADAARIIIPTVLEADTATDFRWPSIFGAADCAGVAGFSILTAKAGLRCAR